MICTSCYVYQKSKEYNLRTEKQNIKDTTVKPTTDSNVNKQYFKYLATAHPVVDFYFDSCTLFYTQHFDDVWNSNRSLFTNFLVINISGVSNVHRVK